MKVTNDKYEYPIEIADSAGQLAIKCGTTAESIRSAIYHSKKTGYKTVYKCVKLEEGEN
jgi:hypothetical protein